MRGGRGGRGNYDRRDDGRNKSRAPRRFDDTRLGPQGQTVRMVPIDIPLANQPSLKSVVGAAPAEAPIDREKICPLLLRVFPKVGAHHRLEEFARRGAEPKEEIQIYTWPDATLRELCDLVKEVNSAARRPAARLSFAFIYPDRNGRNVMRQVGQVHSSRYGDDDDKALKHLGFQTGDFLSVAVY